MPHEFIDKFTNGFPSDWKESIDEFINFLFEHAGRQRKPNQDNPSPTIQEVSPSPEPIIADIPSDFGSPARMASLSPLNSPSYRQTPSTPKTPQTTKVNLDNVTIRRTTQKRRKTSTIYNAAPTPILNRSQRGRVIKPRLGAGERIVYDCYGSPIEARKDITLTHISNRRKSDQLNAVCKALELENAKSPSQAERRLSSIPDRAKSRKSIRKSIFQQRNSLSKLLAYDESKDVKDLDDLCALTPIKFQR